MQATTDGEFRVLDIPTGSKGDITLLDLSDLEPTIVEAAGYDSDGASDGNREGGGERAAEDEDGRAIEDGLAEQVAGLRPGYVIDATLVWDDGTARFTDLTVTSFTLIEYAQGVSGLFEAALETMSEADREGVGVMGRPTHSTDGEPNGAVYAFAEQRGERDIFEEIRSGALPLEPLIDRLEEGVAPSAETGAEADSNDNDDRIPDHEIFVMRPVEHDFVIVYLVLARDSILADTVRDTYNCPRPAEPLR